MGLGNSGSITEMALSGFYCMCMYVCTCVNEHVSVYMYIHAYIHTCIHICTCIYPCVLVQTSAHTFKYIHSLHSTTALIFSVEDNLLVKGSNSTTSLTKPVVRN